MIVDRRRVARLSLRVCDRAQVDPGTRVVQAGLAAAALPGDGRPGELFIRRLRLGTIQLSQGSTVVAQRFSDRIRQLEASAVSVTSGSAATADAVHVRDPVEALALALHHACAGRPLDAWFWRHVDPGLDPGLGARPDPRAVIRLVLRRLLAGRDPELTIPAVFATTLDSGRAPALLSVLDRADGRALLAACTAVAAPEAAPLDPPDPPDLPSGAWWGQLRPALERWGPTDPRTRWALVATLRARGPLSSAYAGSPLLLRAADTLARRLLLPPRVHAPLSAPGLQRVHRAPQGLGDVLETRGSTLTHGSRLHGPRLGSVAAKTAQTPPVSTSERANPGTEPNPVPGPNPEVGPNPEPGPNPRTGPSHTRSTAEAASPESKLARGLSDRPHPGQNTQSGPSTTTQGRDQFTWSQTEHAQHTQWGGLSFVLGVLARLGLEAFLGAHPRLEALSLAPRILAHLADRLEIQATDPIRTALEFGPRARSTPVQFTTPSLWAEALVQDPPGTPTPGQGDTLGALLDLWTLAVEAWLARYADLDLETLARRPAALSCTRTRLDLTFDLDSADLQIRSAALDVDPGWVPWFGRVVRYHYIRGGALV